MLRPRNVAAVVVPALLAAASCTDREPAPRVAVPNELGLLWDLVPHRLSVLELTFSGDGDGGLFTARCDGGGWGAIDVPWARYGITLWESRQLAAEEASVEVAIPPGSIDDGERFAASERLELAAGSLEGASAVVAFVRGFRLSTDEYPEPPPFETDPESPYDPAEGFTSQGLAVSLAEPTLDGESLSVDVRVRNSLGPADRADMNAAIEQATSWVRVDVLFVGAFGDGSHASRGETSYFIGEESYGQNTVHDHAPADEQLVELEGEPGPAGALVGLSSIELWLNVEGHHDPACVVVQDEINSWDEPVSGPARYVRELSARLWDESYDPASGAGSARADLMVSNSSTYLEVGNVCLGARARVSMLQVDDPGVRSRRLEPAELRLVSGESGSVEVDY